MKGWASTAKKMITTGCTRFQGRIDEAPPSSITEHLHWARRPGLFHEGNCSSEVAPFMRGGQKIGTPAGDLLAEFLCTCRVGQAAGKKFQDERSMPHASGDAFLADFQNADEENGCHAYCCGQLRAILLPKFGLRSLFLSSSLRCSAAASPKKATAMNFKDSSESMSHGMGKIDQEGFQ